MPWETTPPLAEVAGKVRVVCSDAYHAERAPLYLDTVLLGWDADGNPRVAPRQGGVLRIQESRQADGIKSFQIRCKCGRTYRAREPQLIAGSARTWDSGARRAVLDIAMPSAPGLGCTFGRRGPADGRMPDGDTPERAG